jgi:hypothetical protein
MTGTLRYAKPVTAAACLVLFAAASGLPAWATAGLLTGILAGLVAFEAISERAPR